MLFCAISDSKGTPGLNTVILIFVKSISSILSYTLSTTSLFTSTSLLSSYTKTVAPNLFASSDDFTPLFPYPTINIFSFSK